MTGEPCTQLYNKREKPVSSLSRHIEGIIFFSCESRLKNASMGYDRGGFPSIFLPGRVSCGTGCFRGFRHALQCDLQHLIDPLHRMDIKFVLDIIGDVDQILDARRVLVAYENAELLANREHELNRR